MVGLTSERQPLKSRPLKIWDLAGLFTSKSLIHILKFYIITLWWHYLQFLGESTAKCKYNVPQKKNSNKGMHTSTDIIAQNFYLPWVNFADTISVIWEVSFMRNSSEPTSPRKGTLHTHRGKNIDNIAAVKRGHNCSLL